MSIAVTTENMMTSRKLFAYLVVDEITLDEEIIHKASCNDGESLSFLGCLYYNRKEYEKAFGWYTLASSQNHQFSQVKLGHMYHTGLGRTKANYELAFDWYLKAYRNGSASAANNIGCMYAKGQGVNQNYATAIRWYEFAANMGSSNAQYNLGLHYEKGTVGPVNKPLALAWYEKSGANGFKRAENGIKRLNKQGHHLFTKQKYFMMEKQINDQNKIIHEYGTRLEATTKQLLNLEQEKVQLQLEVKAFIQERLVTELTKPFTPT